MKNKSAIQILQKLRLASSSATDNEIGTMLQNAIDEFSALPSEYQMKAITQILDFLFRKKIKATTTHNKLDHLVPLIENYQPENLINFLETITIEQLSTIPGSQNSAPLYGTLRKLWKHHTDKPIPDNLQFYGPRSTQYHFLPSSEDYTKLLSDFEQLANNEAEIIWMVLSSELSLRTTEILKKSLLGDLWISNNTVTLSVIGKGNKKRTSTAILSYPNVQRIQQFLINRIEATENNFNAPLFDPDHLNWSDATTTRLRRKSHKCSANIGLHDLRGIKPNFYRANGIHILDQSNSLGHSTTGTAPKSYILFSLFYKRNI